MKIFFLTTLCALLLSLAAPASADYKGEVAAAELGRMVAENNSSLVMINFWASWCGPCKQEIPELMALREKYSKEDLEILGISLDRSPAAAENFATQMGMNYPVYYGNEEIMRKYRVPAIPKLMVYHKGKLVLDHMGVLKRPELEKILNGIISGTAKSGSKI